MVGASVVFDNALRRGAMIIGSDAFVGSVIALLLFENFWVVLLGAIGEMLPDPPQFFHARWPHGPLQIRQRFHACAHSNNKIEGVALAVGAQITRVVALVAFRHNIFDAVLAMARGTG
jgi:hypothetical protein